MSQPSGSMISNGIPNSQVKYQKALKEISKLIQTNKILKSESEQRQKKMGQDLTSIAMKYEQLSKKYEQIMQEKMRMEQFIEQQQDTHAGLNKQYQTMQRQVKYLNDVLIEQNAELKKLSAFKDEKGISELFRSYEDKETSYKKDILRLQEHVVNLQRTIDRLEEDIIEQKQMRQRYQDQYNVIGLQIVKYRDLNNYLINQNQAIINGVNKNNNYNKNKQMQMFVLQFKSQLQNLRGIQYQNQDISEKQYVKNYELILEEKNTMSIQLAKVKDQLQLSQSKVKEMYEMEEKMSNAVAKADVLYEENNMLKNRITLLQSKEILDSVGLDEENQFKDFEDKINLLINKTDPLETIKNGHDNSHFLMMKSFIIELQRKLQSTVSQKEIYQNKYQKLKIKFSKKAEENIIFEQSNKLLKGKLQGYERLTEKLHYELQRSMHAHEDQIVKMVAITNNLVGKKVEESKSASAFIKNQFDIQIEKAQRTQKSLSQQLQALKLQGSTQRIKISDLQQRLRQTSQLLQIYQKKLTENTQRYRQLQEENTRLNEQLTKYEQLYNDEKIRHETILVQKQNLSNRVNLLSQDLSERTYKFEQTLRERDESYSNEIRKLRNENTRVKDEIDLLKEENKKLFTELEERRRRQASSYSSFRQQNDYYAELEMNFQELRHKNRLLEEQLIAIRNKVTNIDQLSENITVLENQLMRKTDELNDLKRANINLKRQIDNLQLSNQDLVQLNQKLTQEIQALRTKLYKQPNSLVSRDSLTSNRQFESKKNTQKLNQQIAILQSAIRDEKRNTSNLQAEIQNYKKSIQGHNEMMARNKKRQQTLTAKASELQDENNKLKDELETLKLKCSHNGNTISVLNGELAQAKQRIAQFSQQITNIKSKLTESDRKQQKIVKEVSGLRYYITEAEKMVKRLSSIERLEWDQQRQKENISTLIDQLNSIIKSSQNQTSSSTSTGEYKFIPTSSFGNIDTGIDQTFIRYSAHNKSSSGGNYDFSYNSYLNSSGNTFNVLREANLLNV